MTRIDHTLKVVPSVLDRLIDLDPRESKEAPQSRTNSLRQLKQSVLRDLDWLLNTRHGFRVPEDLEEATRSVACYGLPDFTSLSVQSHSDLTQLSKDIENAIRFFEPRLQNLTVSFLNTNESERQVGFRIDAQLDVDPTPEPVSFDTVLNSGNGSFTVQQK